MLLLNLSAEHVGVKTPQIFAQIIEQLKLTSYCIVRCVMVVLCLRELSFLSAFHFMPKTHPLPDPAILSNWASPPSSMSHMSWYIYNSNLEILLEHNLCCVVIFEAVTCTSFADLIKCKYIACKFASGINVITLRRLQQNLSTYLSYKLDFIINLSIKCSWVIYKYII